MKKLLCFIAGIVSLANLDAVKETPPSPNASRSSSGHSYAMVIKDQIVVPMDEEDVINIMACATLTKAVQAEQEASGHVDYTQEELEIAQSAQEFLVNSGLMSSSEADLPTLLAAVKASKMFQDSQQLSQNKPTQSQKKKKHGQKSGKK